MTVCMGFLSPTMLTKQKDRRQMCVRSQQELGQNSPPPRIVVSDSSGLHGVMDL